MNVCRRHLSCGHYESQSPDGPQILPLQVVGPGGGRTDCLGEQHHGKCGCGVHLKGQQGMANKGTFNFTAALVTEHLRDIWASFILETPLTYGWFLCYRTSLIHFSHSPWFIPCYFLPLFCVFDPYVLQFKSSCCLKLYDVFIYNHQGKCLYSWMQWKWSWLPS